MSAIEAAIHELQTAPESVVKEAHAFILFLKNRTESRRARVMTSAPDFLARQKTIFGNRTVPDSQSVLDEIRADRF
jgi:hypothetical protein